MNEQIVRAYTVKKRRKGKYKKRETKRSRKEEERVDRARWKDSVRSVTNSGFLHATCLHDNTFDTLDSVVSRLEATFLSSVRFSFKLYVSYTALHCILSRGVPCKEGRGGEGRGGLTPFVRVSANLGINFYFKSSPISFRVENIPLYDQSSPLCDFPYTLAKLEPRLDTRTRHPPKRYCIRSVGNVGFIYVIKTRRHA